MSNKSKIEDINNKIEETIIDYQKDKIKYNEYINKLVQLSTLTVLLCHIKVIKPSEGIIILDKLKKLLDR